MRIEDVSPETLRPVRWPWLGQSWHDLAFLHWAVPPGVVAPLLPRGTMPDTFGEMTYVGLIGFRMVRLGPARVGIPYLGTFLETNVRLYSVDERGRRAVVFRSLDAERLLPVLAARALLRLPYQWSRMTLEKDDGVLRYASTRHWPGPRGVRTSFSIRPGAPLDEPSPLENFLTARWGLHTRAWGRTVHLPNEHPRWPLFRAGLVNCDDGLIRAAGLPGVSGPPASVLYSPGVPVTFGFPSVAAR